MAYLKQTPDSLTNDPRVAAVRLRLWKLYLTGTPWNAVANERAWREDMAYAAKVTL